MPRYFVHHVLFVLVATAGTLFAAPPAAAPETRNHAVTAPDGVALAVQELRNPDGRPVVLIHGLLGSHLDWDAQLKETGLQQYRIITYDLRGHGLSRKPVDADAYHVW